MPHLLEEGHHLISEFEIGIHQLRAHFAQHTWREIAMQYLDDLVASGQKLKVERAALVAERNDLKGQLADLRAQVADDEAKAKAALADMDAEVVAETRSGTSATVTVSAPTTAPATNIPVSSNQLTLVSPGMTVAGPGIADGTIVSDSSDGNITLSQPTTADHAGDGTESLTLTAPATPAMSSEAPAPV